MKTPTDIDTLRAGLLALGLREEVGWLDGLAFTLAAKPERAVKSYADNHGGRKPARFHIDRCMFLLAE